MVVEKQNSKELDINVRHSTSLSGNDKHRIRVLRSLILRLNRRDEFLAENDIISAGFMGQYIAEAMHRHDAISFVAVAHPIRYGGVRYRFDSPLLQPGMIAATYRFKNLDQLQQLVDGLQMPEYLVNPADRCRYHREELILIVLERCALGTRLIDLQNTYHRNHASIGKAISFFCAWIQEHWGYILHDHLNFWQPYMQESRDAIVLKIRDFYPETFYFYIVSHLSSIVLSSVLADLEEGLWKQVLAHVDFQSVFSVVSITNRRKSMA
jgi:hypothetical protein